MTERHDWRGWAAVLIALLAVGLTQLVTAEPIHSELPRRPDAQGWAHGRGADAAVVAFTRAPALDLGLRQLTSSGTFLIAVVDIHVHSATEAYPPSSATVVTRDGRQFVALPVDSPLTEWNPGFVHRVAYAFEVPIDALDDAELVLMPSRRSGLSAIVTTLHLPVADVVEQDTVSIPQAEKRIP